VTGKLDMSGIQIDAVLLMTKVELDEVALVGAHVGWLIINDSEVTGRLDMWRAHVQGRLDLDRVKVSGTLNLPELQVDGSFSMMKAEFVDVNLAGSQVRGLLDISGSKVAGKLEGNYVEAGLGFYLGKDADFAGPVGIQFAKIGELELAGGVFHKTVDITGAQINGELRLGSSRHEIARWPGGSMLILRNAKVDAIQDLANAWPSSLDLNGLTYRSLGGINAADRDPMANRRIEWFKDWLLRQAVYAPAPYEQLATVLRSQGQMQVATEVLYASRERERAGAKPLRYAWLTLLSGLIGYGYYLAYALSWAGALLILGIVVLRLSGERNLSRNETAGSRV
jgi:hypothetical protein